MLSWLVGPRSLESHRLLLALRAELQHLNGDRVAAAAGIGAEDGEHGGHGGHGEEVRDYDAVQWCPDPLRLAGDAVASVVFWYVMLFEPLPSTVYCYVILAVLVLALVLYRVWLVRGLGAQEGLSAQVPYTCGTAEVSGKQFFLVATVHIAPRAPRDVEAVINTTTPDVVMIELDDERLDRMRDVEMAVARAPPQSDLQALRITTRGQAEPLSVYAQRACWNAEWAGQAFSGEVVFDEADPYGMNVPKEDLGGRIRLVHRGGQDKEFAPFALKAHRAAKAGAQAVLCINQAGELPLNRIGGGGKLWGEVKTACYTCDCGFPPVPMLLLPHDEGERICEQLKREGPGAARVDFEVMPDSYPRRTLRKRICQAFALVFSGIGILYGVIQCFAVEVGGEFLAAELVATAKRIPCVCIDVDLDRFWSRLGMAVLPTPTNFGQSLLAWFAFPRIIFQLFFPPKGNVDVPGSMVLHVASFPLRTWVAFVLAGFCASTVTSTVLNLFSSSAEKVAEKTGAVHAETQEDRDAITSWIMLAIEMYMMPRIFDAVAASRDEAMYCSIVRACRVHAARRIVVVAGAGHANGILQRVRTRGL